MINNFINVELSLQSLISYYLLWLIQECGREKLFNCNFCSKSYTRKESLKFHISRKHPNNQNSFIGYKITY